MNASRSSVTHVLLVALASGTLLSACEHAGSETPAAVSAANAPAADVSVPKLSGQPQPLVVRAGSAAMFSVSAQGSAPLHYQWQRDGVHIAGATEPYVVVGAATLADDGARFTVEVRNAHGRITSSAGELFVVDRDASMPWL